MFPLNDNNMSTFIKGQEDGSIDAFEWDMCVLPGYGRAAGWSFTIPTGTEKVDAAEFFINYYIQPEVIARNNTCMPAVIEGLNYGKYNDDNLSVFYEQMSYLKNCPAHPKWSDMQVAVIKERQNALAGSITAEEACAAMETRINALV